MQSTNKHGYGDTYKKKKPFGNSTRKEKYNNMRVIQKNLMYVIGISPENAKSEVSSPIPH